MSLLVVLFFSLMYMLNIDTICRGLKGKILVLLLTRQKLVWTVRTQPWKYMESYSLISDIQRKSTAIYAILKNIIKLWEADHVKNGGGMSLILSKKLNVKITWNSSCITVVYSSTVTDTCTILNIYIYNILIINVHLFMRLQSKR